MLIAGYISESNKSLLHKELQAQKEIFDDKDEKEKKKKWSFKDASSQSM